MYERLGKAVVFSFFIALFSLFLAEMFIVGKPEHVRLIGWDLVLRMWGTGAAALLGGYVAGRLHSWGKES